MAEVIFTKKFNLSLIYISIEMQSRCKKKLKYVAKIFSDIELSPLTKTYAQNVKLRYQYQLFIFRFVSQHCLCSTLYMHVYIPEDNFLSRKRLHHVNI